jgi:hypothetical protein
LFAWALHPNSGYGGESSRIEISIHIARYFKTLTAVLDREIHLMYGARKITEAVYGVSNAEYAVDTAAHTGNNCTNS